MKHKGKIVQWHDEKGYGFIEPRLPGARVFLHIADFNNKSRRPIVGDQLVYQLQSGTDGKSRAVEVIYSTQDKQALVKKNPSLKSSSLLTIAFSIGLLVLVWLAIVPIFIGGIYLIMSLFSLFLYWQDKLKARSGQWRTPESVLLLAGLAGGWPGAVLAQQWLRHKSVKVAFRNAFWATVAINVAALAIWYDKGFLLPF